MNLEDFFGEPIFKYTRAQALADGVLVDVTSTAREAGWRWPVAVTAALWEQLQTIPAKAQWQDWKGRLWDVIFLAAQAAKRARAGENQIEFQLHLSRDRGGDIATLLAHVGPGDNGEPVATIGFPSDF